jgi:hypothetical protein
MVLDCSIIAAIAFFIERIPVTGFQNNRFESPGTASSYSKSPDGAKD